jgi:hypothetical protein
MAAGLAFHPELLAGPAPKMGFSRFEGFFEGSPVHPGHHEYSAAGLFLNNRGNQAVAIKLQFFDKGHGNKGYG